ncbi:hypothetical protein ACLMJK_008741 [Lecanora helva]
MNSNAFPNGQGPGFPQQVNQPNGGMQRNGGTSSDIQNSILTIIQSQPSPPGWQRMVHPRQRAVTIHQMVTGLRIVKPEMPLQYAISVATGFELQQFNNAPNQESYNQATRQKLSEIQATRQNQANMQQQQLQNQQAAQMGFTPQQLQANRMMNGQNQFPPGFGMSQPPQPGQPLGVPMQQQVLQNQRPMQPGNPAEMQQPFQNPLQSGQQMQNVPRPAPSNRGPPQLSPEEIQQVNNRTRNVLAEMSEQARAELHQRVSTNLPPQQQQQLQANGVDPVAAFVQRQTTQLFINEKQRRMQMNGQGLAAPNNGMMQSQGRPMSQVSVRNQQQSQHPPTSQQQTEPPLGMGTLDQFVGQQQEGLLRQAAGQDVVPASNGQAGPPQMRGTPHQPPQGQFVPNRPAQPPNFQPQPPQWNNQQNHPSNVQSGAQKPMQPQTPNFTKMQGQTPQQQSFQGQLGGLGNNRGQRTPQQSHNMPTLNRPMDPPSQTRNDPGQRASQVTPKQGQRDGPNGQPQLANNNQPTSSQPIPSPANFPPRIQNILRGMTEDQGKKWLMNMKQKQLEQKQLEKNKVAAAAQNPGNVQASAQSGPQSSALGVKTGQPNNVQNNNNGQTISAANATSQQPPANVFGQGNTMQPQQLSNQGSIDPHRPAPPKMLPMHLNETQIRFMDSQFFPPAILNKNNSLGQLPATVKTWRDLKEYVQQRAQNLPPQSMQNVLGLQSIHMQQLSVSNVHKQRLQQQGLDLGSFQPGQTGQAPQAPSMIPQPSNQAPLPGNAPPGQFPLPQLSQPTVQEVVQLRATLPENLKGMSDMDLRRLLMHKRQQEFLKKNFARLNPQQQQQMLQRNSLLNGQAANTQQGQQFMGQNQLHQPFQPPRPQGQPPQPVQQQSQHSQAPKQPPGPQGRQSQSNSQGNLTQKEQQTVKRPTSDDVVEVPDPKTQQQPRQPNARPRQSVPVNNRQLMTQENFSRLSNEQKAQVQAKMRETQAMQRAKSATTSQGPSAQASTGAVTHHGVPTAGQDAQRHQMLEGLYAEVARNTPKRALVPMSPETRSVMIEKLKDKTGSYIQRVEQSLPVFLQKTSDMDQAKDLLRMREILLRQVRNGNFENPVNDFTMTIPELDEYKGKLYSYLVFILRAFQPQLATAAAAATREATSSQPQQLSAKNLQQHQETFNAARLASAQQKTQGNNTGRAPAAPTATHPPFPFGSQSPQGVPQIYAATKNELTQDQLKLPQAKKRKPNQIPSAVSTPVQATSTPVAKASPAAKMDSPEAQRAPVVPNMMKCPVPDCESGKMGFATKEELEKHRLEVHEPKEPAIKDPFDAAAYAIESLRLALNLDENGKSRPAVPSKDDQQLSKEDRPLQAPAMKASASSQSHKVKQEVATPMSRNPTQTGPSPASNLLRTPQATAAPKTPASDAKSTSKDAGSKGSTEKSAQESAADPWANSHVQPKWFKEVFSDAATLNRPVSDEFIAGWLERNPFTPPTSPSSGAIDKDSPFKSDISANDNLTIDLVAEDDNWLPWQWFEEQKLQGDMEALDVGGMTPMDWAMELDQSVNEEETLGKGKRRRDPMEPSDEWLKAWAPDKYEEKVKQRDVQRKR